MVPSIVLFAGYALSSAFHSNTSIETRLYVYFKKRVVMCNCCCYTRCRQIDILVLFEAQLIYQLFGHHCRGIWSLVLCYLKHQHPPVLSPQRDCK